MRVLALTALFLACLTATAEADTLSDFEAARAAYEDQRYDDAANLLERIVTIAATDAVSVAIVLESRKYLAASYLFLGRTADANTQFVLLLRQEPDYALDPVRFPRDVLTTFDAARRQVEGERADEARARAEAERLRDAERLARDAAYREMLEGLATETTVVQNSRAIAVLPFGIGQFQNRRRGLGIFFAVAESALTISAVSSYLVHFRNSFVDRPDDVTRSENRETRANIANWSSVGLLSAVAIVGILEAQINFVPTHTTTRRRAVDPSLLPNAPLRPTATFGVGLGNVNLRLQF